MEQGIDISRFLDETGKVTKLPKKAVSRQAVLYYLAGKFEAGRDYSEKEVNAVCDAWHTFADYFLIRRELIESGHLCRKADGSRYWKPAIE